MERYILWDWNGTLLDDTSACCVALDAMLTARGLKPIDLDFFRKNFSFPARGFYDRLGMATDDANWDAMADEYYREYLRSEVSLNKEALAAVRLVHDLGARQSIVSALRQDYLDRDTAAFGIAQYMEHIRGTDNLHGASKLERARVLLKELAAPGREFVFIGDALHDKEVADAMGVGCVLFTGGSHSSERLEGVAPTAATLTEAVRLALA